jgi:hypothetical protein
VLFTTGVSLPAIPPLPPIPPPPPQPGTFLFCMAGSTTEGLTFDMGFLFKTARLQLCATTAILTPWKSINVCPLDFFRWLWSSPSPQRLEHAQAWACLGYRLTGRRWSSSSLKMPSCCIHYLSEHTHETNTEGRQELWDKNSNYWKTHVYTTPTFSPYILESVKWRLWSSIKHHHTHNSQYYNHKRTIIITSISKPQNKQRKLQHWDHMSVT